MMDDNQYYFKWRLRNPTGEWVVCGPFGNYDQAKREREKSKAVDVEVTIPFLASSKEEAQKRNA